MVATYKGRPASELTHEELLAAYEHVWALHAELNATRASLAALAAAKAYAPIPLDAVGGSGCKATIAR